MGLSSSKPPSQFELIDQAEAKAKKGAYDDALSLFQQAVEVQPTYYFTYMRRARLLKQLERYDDALLDIEDCLRFRPAEFDAMELRASIFEAQGEDELAVMERSRIPLAARTRIREQVERAARLESGAQDLGSPSRYAEREAQFHKALRHDQNRRMRIQGKRGMYVQSDRDRQRIAERQEFRRNVTALDAGAPNGYLAVGP